MGRVIAAAVVAAVLVAAGGAAAQDGAPVAYRTLERDDGGSSGYDARTTLIVRTKRRWRHVWGRLHAGMLPKPPRPRVDFRRSTVIAVLGGPGTGSGLHVEAVTRGADGLRVRAVETRAGAGCVVAQMIVKPYEVIRVARTAASVATTQTEHVRDC